MYKAKITFLGNIRSITKIKVINIPIEAGETIGTILPKLFEKFGEDFKRNILNSKGEVKQGIMIRHNGENIIIKKGLETIVSNNDAIIFTPVIAGG